MKNCSQIRISNAFHNTGGNGYLITGDILNGNIIPGNQIKINDQTFIEVLEIENLQFENRRQFTITIDRNLVANIKLYELYGNVYEVVDTTYNIK